MISHWLDICITKIEIRIMSRQLEAWIMKIEIWIMSHQLETETMKTTTKVVWKLLSLNSAASPCFCHNILIYLLLYYDSAAWLAEWLDK